MREPAQLVDSVEGLRTAVHLQQPRLSLSAISRLCLVKKGAWLKNIHAMIGQLDCLSATSRLQHCGGAALCRPHAS